MMNREFAEWLKSGSQLFSVKVENDTYLFLRLPKRPGFDYLFAQRKYFGEGMLHAKPFDFVGIYNAADGLIYNMVEQPLSALDNTLDERSAVTLLNNLEKSVCENIESRVKNDRRNLNVQELTEQSYKNRLNNFCQHYVSNHVREIYLHGKSPESYEFKCRYAPVNWTEDSLLDYIADPAAYVQRESDRYWNNSRNQDEMLFTFLVNDAVSAEYKKLIADTGNQAHTVRRIMEAVNSVDAKMVTVTIHKDGQDFTFKTEASVLRRDCTNTYGIWYIVAADRREFERRFGRSAEYAPGEIVRISYRGKTLYEANESVEAQC